MKLQDFVITLRMSDNLITPTVIAPLSIQVLKKLLQKPSDKVLFCEV